MPSKGQILIGVTVLMLTSLMIYFLVAASQETSNAGMTDKIGEYQIRIANAVYHQKELENYFYLSSKNGMSLALLDFFIESHKKTCENFVDPIFNNCEVDYETYLKKEFGNRTRNYMLKHDYVNETEFVSSIRYDDNTETIETEVITDEEAIPIIYENTSLGKLIYQQEFKINNSLNPEIFQLLYDFVEEVLYHHETENAMEELEYDIQNFNQGSYGLIIENNPCETNEFIELFEEAYYCSDSPHQNCECVIHQFYGQSVMNFSIIRDGENTSFKRHDRELKIQKNIPGFEKVSHELIGNIQNKYVIINGVKEYFQGNMGIRNGELTHTLAEDSCIRDITIQRLCAKLDIPIVILDNTITEIPFDIEYYAKPKPVEHVQVQPHESSFIVSWNAPQNRAYKYYIYNSAEQITNDNLGNLVWEGIGEFTQYPENNKLFLENNRIRINITSIPLPFTSIIQENTKGLKSRVS